MPIRTRQRSSADRGGPGERPGVPGSPAAAGEGRGAPAVPWQETPASRGEPRTGRALPNRRSPVLIVAGVLCAVLGALGGAFAWTQASRAQLVLVMNRAVARGEELRSGDIGVVSISVGEQVDTLPASRLDGLIGRRALVDLPRGSLLGGGSVGATTVPAGSAHVGLKLAAGRVPTEPMPAGTRITVVEVADGLDAGPASGAAAAGQGRTQVGGTQRTASPRTVDAVVSRAPVRADDRTGWLLDIEVGQADAAPIADLAARDRVAVIVRGS